MFRPGDRWRHKNCLDIDLIIVAVTYAGPSLTRAKVLYWQRHMGALMTTTTETVTIKRKDFGNWQRIED